MADETITRLYGMPADEVFEVVCTAVSDLAEYEVKQVHTEVLWGHWATTGSHRHFLEIQVSPRDEGCRVDLELRNADLRDRIGLLRREANRIAGRIQQRLEGSLTGFEPPPPKRAITDRMVIVGMLVFAFGSAIVATIGRGVASLFW